jgi:hypothetical protein
MLYIGVILHDHSLKLTVLSESFAYLGSKYLFDSEARCFYDWLNSHKCNQSETCLWYFDDVNFKNHKNILLAFCFDFYCNDVYLVSHRRVLNIFQFLYEWAVHNESYLTFDIDESLILASSVRLFNPDEFIFYDPDSHRF